MKSFRPVRQLTFVMLIFCAPAVFAMDWDAICAKAKATPAAEGESTAEQAARKICLSKEARNGEKGGLDAPKDSPAPSPALVQACDDAYASVRSQCVRSAKGGSVDISKVGGGGGMEGAALKTEKMFKDLEDESAAIGGACISRISECESACGKLPESDGGQNLSRCGAMKRKLKEHQARVGEMIRNKKEAKDIADKSSYGEDSKHGAGGGEAIADGGGYRPSSIPTNHDRPHTSLPVSEDKKNSDEAREERREERRARREQREQEKMLKEQLQSFKEPLNQAMSEGGPSLATGAGMVPHHNISANYQPKDAQGTYAQKTVPSHVNAGFAMAGATGARAPVGQVAAGAAGSFAGRGARVAAHAASNAFGTMSAEGQTTGQFGVGKGTAVLDGPAAEAPYHSDLPNLKIETPSGAGSPSKSRGLSSLSKNASVNLAEYLPNGRRYKNGNIGGMDDPSGTSIQPQTRDIWNLISERFRVRCAQDLLVDCAKHLPR